VLACLEAITDPDREELEKRLFIAKRFFCGNPPPDMDALFSQFVVGESEDSDEDQPLLDFGMDAGVIYASFRQQYGINLATETLHWWEFRMLLSGLGEGTPLGSRVQLRSLDLNTIPENERPKWRKLKDMVAITPRMSKAEADLQTELDRRIQNGEDVTEIIEQLRG